MPTTRTNRTPSVNTTWTARPKRTKWLDYLYGDNQWFMWNIQNETWEDIVIYTDSWYKEIETGTTWTARPKRTKWLDYLYWNNQWIMWTVQDETWEDISIYADSWYEEIKAETTWNKRIPI
jgi:hypothetical protein